MANRYTYDDFQRAMQSSGLGGQFSDADLRLAQQNPDAGMSILKYKQDYANAATDEARALANMGAEGIRSSYGGYTGGTQGSQYYLDPLSPRDFQSAAAPAYQNRYDSTIQDLLGQLINRKEFSYDPETDQLYSQYRKQYTREGQRATQDALGAAAAASGGIPSSYAVTAASQAGDYYASQMTDKIPELYQLAYNKYMNDYNMQLSDLGAVQGAEQSDYEKYLNALNQYNADRSFSYGQFLDEVNNQTARRSEELNRALTAADVGDYSFLQKMGVDTSNVPVDYERQLQLAQLAAQYGDYSGLRELGISPAVSTGTGRTGGGSDAAAGSNTNGAGMTLSDSDIAAISGMFPSGVIDDATWESYVRYGVSEEVLRAAGFKKAGDAGAYSSPFYETTGAYRFGDTGKLFTDGQYKGFRQTVGMQRTVDGKVEIIRDAVSEGKITQAQAEELLKQYGISY